MSDHKTQNLQKIHSHVSFIVISSPNPDLNTHNTKFCKSLFYWTANRYVLMCVCPSIIAYA
jgi:hypothetical protein